MDVKQEQRSDVQHSEASGDNMSGENAINEKSATSEKVLENGTVLMFLSENETGTRQRLLIPRPTADPDDPLNWTRTRKNLYIMAICYFGFIGTLYVACISTMFLPLYKDFQQTVDQFNFTIAFCILVLGLGGFFWVPTTIKYGRRPVYIFSTIGFLACTIWTAVSPSYGSLLAARLLTGFFAASVESMGNISIADVYFLHERGEKIGILSASIFGGSQLGPVVVGYIVQAGGWRWGFWFTAILAGISAILSFFLIPESAYPRSAMSLIGQADSGDGDEGQTTVLPLRPYVSTLSPFSRVIEGSWFKIFLRPFATFAFMPVCWATLVFGIFCGIQYIVIGCMAAILPGSPYNFNSGAVGLTNLSPLIGNILGIPIGGWLSDWVAARATAKNGGIREPEMRLPVLFIGGAVGTTAIVMFGQTVGATSWVPPVVAFGMLAFSLFIMTNVLLTYIIDAYYTHALEVLVVIQSIKNVVVCVLLFYSGRWWQEQGTKKSFGIMGAIYALAVLSTFAMIFYGKQFRFKAVQSRAYRFLETK